MIRESFAALYETIFGIYSDSYPLIFQTLYDYGGYIKLGLLFLVVPLFLWLLFYLVWRYPYAKFWQWALWMIITILIAFGCTWSVANTAIFASPDQQLLEVLADPGSGYEGYAKGLLPVYSLINAGLSLLIGFLYSLILKQFSKIQMHLPF